MHTVEPLVPGPSHLKVETATAKLKKYKSPSIYQTLVELIQAVCERLMSTIHQLIHSNWNKDKLPEQVCDSNKNRVMGPCLIFLTPRQSGRFTTDHNITLTLVKI
jgi:hypothetical protein